MKLRTIALVTVFAMGPTLAFAQAGGSMNSGSGNSPGMTSPGMTSQRGHSEPMTTGQARGRSTGSDITTGSDVPRDKPNLSNSPESSDTSQRVK
jgi:hypothetical protein